MVGRTQVTTADKEEAPESRDSDLGKLLIWVFTLMIGIGAFYGGLPVTTR